MAAKTPIIKPYVNTTSQGAYDYSYASLSELAWASGTAEVPEFRTDIYPKYHRLYGDGFRLLTFLYAAGLVLPPWTSSAMVVMEETEMEKAVGLKAAVAAGGAAGATRELVIADLDKNYPLLGRSIFIPGEFVNSAVSTTPAEYVVTAYNTSTQKATIKPMSKTTHTAELPAGLKLTVGGAKFGRGQGQPAPFRKRNLQRAFYTTMLGESARWDGGVNTYRPELGVVDSQGHKTLFDKGVWETEFMSDRSMDKTIFLSEINANDVTKVNQDNVAGNIKSFVGIRNHLDDRAQQLQYIETIEPQDLKKIREIHESQGVMADMSWAGVGPRLFENMQDSGMEFIKNGYSPGTDMFKNLENLGAQFKVFDLYGHKLITTELKTFADINGLGNSSYKLPQEGFIIPMANQSVTSDGKKLSLPNIGLGFRKGNNENREFMAGVVAGVNGMGYPFKNQWDATSYYQKREFGIVALGVNQWINITKVDA